MTCRPTPPHPMTQAVSPIRTRATLRTAPTPVTTAQPSSAACQSGNPSGNRHRGCRVDHAALGEARDHQPVLQRVAGRVVQARGAVHQRAARHVHGHDLAQGRPSSAALRAAAARRHEAERDAIARRDVRDAGGDGLHEARALVAEHHRPPVSAQHAVGEVDVGVADPRRGDPHLDLAGAGWVEPDRLDLDGAPGFAEHGCAHRDRAQSTR